MKTFAVFEYMKPDIMQLVFSLVTIRNYFIKLILIGWLLWFYGIANLVG